MSLRRIWASERPSFNVKYSTYKCEKGCGADWVQFEYTDLESINGIVLKIRRRCEIVEGVIYCSSSPVFEVDEMYGIVSINKFERCC